MADNNSDRTNPAQSGRRGSIASQALAELFGTGKPRSSFGSDPNNYQPGASGNQSSTSSSAAIQAQQRRRMSVSGSGMSGYNGNPSKRSDSLSSSGGSFEESAIEEGEPLAQGSPSTPFGRRMSFGARALRDVRVGSGSGGAGNAQTNESGYNWADSFRNRAERSSSNASVAGSPNISHVRAKSVATMQPPPIQQEAPRHMVPDHFQERILKGDFYMD